MVLSLSTARRAVLAALCVLALALAACSPEPPPAFTGYENTAWGVRFSPAKGWTVAETAVDGCLFAVEASSGPDARFQICVSAPRPEILLTQNTFVSCENVKQYVREALKGVNPLCTPGKVWGEFAYDTLYVRLLQSGDRVRVQCVNHLFVPLPGRLVQVIAYTLGDDEKAARDAFEANRVALMRMISSTRLR